MALKITADKKSYPKGQEFEIAGLGLLKNGEAVTITEQQEHDYAVRTGQLVKDAFKDSEEFKVEGTSELKGGLKDIVPETISDTYNPTPAAEPAEEEEEKKEVTK